VASGLGLRVEGGVEVLRVDPRKGSNCGRASTCGFCEVVVKGGAWGSSPVLYVVVNVHAGGSG
jgi:hypothetical protein